MKNKTSTPLSIVIIQFCLSITFIMGTLLYFNDFIISGGILLKIIATLTFSIGGIGLYLPFGYLIRFFSEKYMKDLK